MRRINSGCGGVLDKQRRWGFVMAVEVFQWRSRTKRGDDGGGQRRWLWTAMLAVMAVIEDGDGDGGGVAVCVGGDDYGGRRRWLWTAM
ncbi:hypothetical protein Tco_1199631 [Tanacetum coccineum]